MKMKATWKVSPAPTGPYSSFEVRCWPEASFKDGTPAAFIRCQDEYYPKDVKTGHHKELTLIIADHSVTPFKWAVVKERFKTLDELKASYIKIIDANPGMLPTSKDTQ